MSVCRTRCGLRGPGARALLTTLCALALLLLAAPAGAATTHDVAVVGSAFNPPDLSIAVGDTVRWTFGDLVDHTATASSGPEPFDSGPRRSGDTPYEKTFTADATYNYLCSIHPGMTARLRVGSGGSPGGGGGGYPGPGTAGGDTAAPTIGSLRVSPFRARSFVRFLFSLSEPAEVKGRVRRARRPRRAVRSFARDLGTGDHSLRFSVRRLRPGPYDLFLSAEDAAGNDAAQQRRRFHVRRRAGASASVRARAAGGARAGPPSARAAASSGVTVRDFEFAPRNLSVSVGDTVTWTNQGPTAHTATARDGSFDTGNLRRGQSGSHTFDRAGTFRYYCRPHPGMTATVTVGGGSGGGSSSGAGGTGGASGSGAAGSSEAGGGSSSGDSSLPLTGFEAGTVALLGALLLGAGTAVRRRPRRAPR